MPACLAVNGVDIVPLQTVVWAGKLHLVGLQDRTREPKEDRHPEDHDGRKKKSLQRPG